MKVKGRRKIQKEGNGSEGKKQEETKGREEGKDERKRRRRKIQEERKGEGREKEGQGQSFIRRGVDVTAEGCKHTR